MNNYKFKLFIFILLLVFLSVVLFYSVFGFSLSYLTEEEIKSTRKPKDNLINFLKINDIDTVYDEENDIYYYSVPDEYENTKYTLKLNLDDNYKYKIVGHSTNIITINYEKTIDIIIFNDNYYYETQIQLTNLPLISITTDSDITRNDTNSIFKYINPSNLDQIINYNSKIHIRGATSTIFDKKSYKLEIYNSTYEKEKDINISNFYYGSAFILDATYRDNSKIRNVLATEIWNGISDDFNNIDVYSEFVEMFINGKYMGIYVFTEPINRTKLNLSKSSLNDTSVIVKSTDWDVPTTDNFNNIIDDKYLGYELKYPNDEEMFNKSWSKILPKLYKYYNNETKINKEDLDELFNINNYVDMIIFNSFINNLDNGFAKNNYFYMQNLSDKIYIQPWDMEFSFGLRYTPDKEEVFKKDMSDYENILFDIKHESKEINKLLINRYWNLRRSILNTKYLDQLLDNYKDKLTSGAAKRDSNLWLDYDIEKEIEDIRIWIYNRIKVYDNYIRGLENG